MIETSRRSDPRPGSQDAGQPASPANMAKTADGRVDALTLMFDLIIPIGSFYGLRAAGVGTYPALLAGAVLPGLTAVVRLIRHRRPDRLGMLVMAMMLLGAGVSLVTGSPQFLLAKEGWITGLWGAWFLASLPGSRPLAFRFSRQLLEGRTGFRPPAGPSQKLPAASWDDLWETIPGFRRIWRISTLIWGCALLADAAIRVAMAYTMPIDLVPALGGALWPVTFIALQVITNIYYYRAGLWRMLRQPAAARHA